MTGSSTGRQLELPVIDLSSPLQETSKKLLEATSTHGFVYIKSTSVQIQDNTLREIWSISEAFFASPLKEKQECTIGTDNAGWTAMHAETLDPLNQKRGDAKEAFNLTEFHDGKAQQHLPQSLKASEQRLSDFADLCKSLCLDLLELFAAALQISTDQGGRKWFSSCHDKQRGPSGCTLRLLYYPRPRERNEESEFTDIRAGAHSDYGSITLLFQRPAQPGLEILTADGTWAPVEISPSGTEFDPYPPVLVNVGDLLSYWTSNLLRSTVHRVVCPQNETRDRYSIAYFCHPVNSTPLVPVPSQLVEAKRVERAAVGSHNGRAKVMTAWDHLQIRLAATYGFSKLDMNDPAFA